jgi:hypothetical protein
MESEPTTTDPTLDAIRSKEAELADLSAQRATELEEASKVPLTLEGLDTRVSELERVVYGRGRPSER